MLKLLSSTSRQIQTHLKPPCLRFTTESHPSSFLKLLCSLTGLIHGNHKSLSFYRRAFFCSGSSSGDGGDGGGFVEVEVRSGASEIGAEGGAADASYSSAIVPSNPRPEDYLMVYKRLKLALLMVKKEMETSKIQGRFLQGTIFPINKQGKRQFSSLSLDESPTPTITNMISNQHWSKLKAHLQNTDPNTLLLQLLNSGADPELTLRYFTWSQKEFKLSHSLELTFRILNSLALAKKYSKIRSFLHKFVKYETDYSVSAIFHAISMSGDSFCVNSILADMLVLAYVQNLKILRGFEAFKRAGDYGFKLSLISCNPLLSGLVKETENGDVEFVEGNLRAALIVRTRMERKGKQANVVTYNVLIKGFCLKGKLEDANGLLNEMLERGLVPNRTTYEIIKEEMMEKGFVPDIEGHRKELCLMVSTQSCLIAGLCRRSDLTDQESQRLVAREGNLRAALNEKGRIKDFCSKGKLEGANGFSMRYWIWVWCQIEQLLNR
ncbi:hypothetical protein OIU79_018680 [Salix purpurea]|uniref:Pentatricopeptide repeat-containing protein n=1 Tax=Salix purpurea TaxID=77065 RepID=A0A9Q1ALP4_SALPP|nr:hypothetical protein OIU79_018680 [Salix purpurea]